MDDIRLTASWEEDSSTIRGFISQLCEHDKKIDILEAGCGNCWDINLKGIPFILTGVDLDEDALNIRKNVSNDLDRVIVGDLSSVDIDPNSFDVIYNSFVLEHIENADVVMNNFVRWIRPGGIIIIRIPDPQSVQGFITKISPHWFHVFYYKYILRDPHAGMPGYAPYPTHYHPLVSRSGIADFCAKNGLSLIHESADSYHIPGTGLIKTGIQVFKRIMNILSLGKLSHKHTNLLFVIKKPS